MVEEVGQPFVSKLRRFDRAIILIITSLLLMTGVIIWQRARISVPVERIVPAADAHDVPVTTVLQVEYAEPMDTTVIPQMRADPAVSGQMLWLNDRTLIFRPERPLQENTYYHLALTGDLRNQSGQAARTSVSWNIHTREARILYLAWDSQERSQVYVTSPAADSPSLLTNAEYGVIDYTVSPQGHSIAYSSTGEAGGTELWLLNTNDKSAERILECSDSVCTNALWTPNGTRLIYERRQLFNNEDPPGPPRLWWLDPGSGKTLPVFAGDETFGLGARFSADGKWLSYIVPQKETAHIYEFESGSIRTFPNSIGEPAVWHPQENRLLSTDIEFQDERFAVHIFEVDINTGEMVRLSNQAETNDIAPAWSPDGEWIAFGRKIPRVAVGRQLWLLSADGSESRSLTSEPEVNHGPPRWSPDGRLLLFQRFHITEPNAEPGISLIDVETGELMQVAETGFEPSWLP